MQQRPDLNQTQCPDVLKRSVLLVVLGFTCAALTACTSKDTGTGCVSVGGGWQACSADDPATSADAGATPALDSGGQPLAMPDAGHPTVISPKPVLGGASAGAPIGVGTTGGIGGSASASGIAGNGGASIGSAGEAGAAGNRAIAAGSAGKNTGGAGSDAGRGGSPGSQAGRGGAAADGGTAGTSSLPSACCRSMGVCVSGSELSAEQRSFLGRETCADQAAVCAPVSVLDKTFVPKTCRSVLQAEGRCLPACVSTLARQGARYPEDVCEAHEVCAPCFDPTTGAATGACSMGADPGPHELAQVFGSCCNMQGDAPALCVPQSYLPADTVMPQADCGANLFCVPRALVSDPAAKLAQCMDDVRGSGVCVSQCIAGALTPLITTQSTCTASEQCYPCAFIGGATTGVCGSQ